MAIDPLTAGAMGMYGLGNVLGAFGGSDAPPGTGFIHNINPQQQALMQMMQRAMMPGGGGLGDLGYGQAVKQGTSQLSQMMADRGIAPGSGVADAAMGNMLGQAAAQEGANRLNVMMGLAGMGNPWAMHGQENQQGLRAHQTFDAQPAVPGGLGGMAAMQPSAQGVVPFNPVRRAARRTGGDMG